MKQMCVMIETHFGLMTKSGYLLKTRNDTIQIFSSKW